MTHVTDSEKASVESRVDVLQDAVSNMQTRVRQLDAEMTRVMAGVMILALAVLVLSKTTRVAS